MKYTRYDLIGQKEEFEGEPLEIITMIKLLNQDFEGKIKFYIDNEGDLYTSFEEGSVITDDDYFDEEKSD